ncbi:hypothetical protein Vc3S01_1880 [Vibrio campbellii]|jgi:hypothetical protein|nr:hypothetical protein Vc3S01_1880 [Vibrio campbellii]EDL66845.1 hypothetical protein A1Q_2143 [Vibrio campbellii HY01]|tara:strand:- start:951 stop:1076 length:126 start_codon:yes stop_codon:yes gene_type:complete
MELKKQLALFSNSRSVSNALYTSLAERLGEKTSLLTIRHVV